MLEGAAPCLLGKATPNGGEAVDAEFSQALLRDPAVLQQEFKPGVTTELSGNVGDQDQYGVGFRHRDQYAEGKVHDFSLGGLVPPLKVTAADHEGGGWVQVFQVKGGKLVKETDWFRAYPEVVAQAVAKAE